MTESSSVPPDEGNEDKNKLLYDSTTFEKLQDLLSAKDDTSRFVGLALLKSILDNGQLHHDPEQVEKLWEVVPVKFLDRLLKSHSSLKLGKAEAKDMMDLAISVIHTFTVLLPEEAQRQKRLVKRMNPLVQTLLPSSADSVGLILQTLLTLVSQIEGAIEFLSIDDLSSVTEIALENPLVLEIFDLAWANASTASEEAQIVQESIEKTISGFLVLFKGTDAVTFLAAVAKIIAKTKSEALPQNPKWLKSLVTMLCGLTTRRPTLAGRAAYTQLAAALLQAYPAQSSSLIFKHKAQEGSQDKPFSYLFINLILIDIRSSFPSLLSKLNSTDYPAISQRLAAAFDVLSSFIGFLVRSLDEPEDFGSFNMPPDLLLRLRKDIAETMSLNIEYLRDRWDASFAGAPGLHPSARSGTSATSAGTRLTLTWENKEDAINADPLVAAGIRSLAIWIREDENENLRNESAGLIDMFMELYKSSSVVPGSLDLRYPILLALEGIMTTDDGVDRFLEQDGWETLFRDLEVTLKGVLDKSTVSGPIVLSEAARGLEAVRDLLIVIDHWSTTSPREDWMAAIKTTASMRPPSSSSYPLVLELQIAMLQLSMALLSKAPLGMQRRYGVHNSALSGITTRLSAILGELDDDGEAGELAALLQDVRLDLDNLESDG